MDKVIAETSSIKRKHKGTIGIIGPAINVAKLSKYIVQYSNSIGLDDDQYVPEVIALGVSIDDVYHIQDAARFCFDYGCDSIAWADVTAGAESLKAKIEKLSGISMFGCGAGIIDDELKKLAKKMVDCAINMEESLIRRPKLTNEDELTIASNLVKDGFLRSRRVENTMSHGGYSLLKPKGFVSILGGAGPLASAEMSLKLAESGVPFVHWSVNSAPGKLAFELGGPSYDDYYRNAIEFFISIGAKSIIIPCNTAHKRLHHFCPEDAIDKILDIRKAALESDKASDQFIILGTPATTGVGLKSKGSEGSVVGIYEAYRSEKFPYLKPFIVPNEVQQDKITRAIFQVKRNNLEEARILVEEVVDEMRAVFGMKVPVVLACTELPLAFPKTQLMVKNMHDPTQVLVRMARAILNPSVDLKPSEAQALLRTFRSRL